MGTFANSISSGSALFSKTKSIFKERNTIVLEVITSDPSIYTNNNHSFIENSNSLKRGMTHAWHMKTCFLAF